MEPGNGALDDPAFGQDGESFGLIRTLDDFDFEARPDFRQCGAEPRPLVGGVGNELDQERMQSEQCREQQDAAIAILDIGGMNDCVQQQTQRVYENVALLALDLLARIIAVRIKAGPPFSAPFTLWLSMMAAVGLGSRSLCSRHST